MQTLKWHDPRKKIWGFHLHQELPLEDFSKALVVQKNGAEFLKNNNIPVDNDDVTRPGYGPHIDYTWELRVETLSENSLEKMGLAITYMALNRFGLSAYIHPLMQDTSLSDEESLAEEGHENEGNALWFGYRVQQNLDFFFNPPKDDHGQIIDTRTSRILSREEKEELYTLGVNKLHDPCFLNPFEKIINGFHIHMDVSDDEEALALTVFDKFLIFLLGENLRPTSTRLYGPGENGPHVFGGWEVKFETKHKEVLEKIGIAIGWLMCNRQGLSVFMHPVTWEEGDHQEELKAHKEYSFFLGEMPALDLRFFSDKIVLEKNYEAKKI